MELVLTRAPDKIAIDFVKFIIGDRSITTLIGVVLGPINL